MLNQALQVSGSGYQAPEPPPETTAPAPAAPENAPAPAADSTAHQMGQAVNTAIGAVKDYYTGNWIGLAKTAMGVAKGLQGKK
jgi:hypothetical protein